MERIAFIGAGKGTMGVHKELIPDRTAEKITVIEGDAPEWNPTRTRLSLPFIPVLDQTPQPQNRRARREAERLSKNRIKRGINW